MRRLTMPRVAFYSLIGLTIALCLLLTPRLAPAAPLAGAQKWSPDGGISTPASATAAELASGVGLESPNNIVVMVAGTNVTATTGTNVAIGEVITYSVVITVNDNSTYDSVVLTSTLSDGLAFITCTQITANTSITTSVTGSFPAVCTSPTVINSGRNISFTFGTVRNANSGSGSAEAVTVQFTAVVLNTSANNAGDVLTAKARWRWSIPTPAGYVGSSENVVIYEPSLTLSKSGNTGTPRTGQNVAFTLELSNDNTVTYPAVAYDVVVTDTIPAGMTYADNVTTLQGKSPDSFITDTVRGVITATWNYVAPGDLIRLRYYATVNTDVPARTVITNTAGLVASSLPGSPAQPISSHNTSSTERTGYDVGSQADAYRHDDYAIVTVTTPDLVITKSDGVTSVAPADTLTYTIRVTNTGNYHADSVVVTETVPVNAVFLASPRSSSGWSCANNAPAGTTCLYAFSGGDNPLNAGSSVSNLRFVVRVNNPVLAGAICLTNTVSVGDEGNHGVDPTPGNNTFSDVNDLSGQIDLTLTKRDSGAPTAGKPITYTISYTNLGTTTATNIVLTETVPVSTSYSSGAPWTCVPSSGVSDSVCTRSLPDLTGGASGTATFTVTVASPLGSGIATFTNTVSIGVPGGADVNTSNNTATIMTAVDAAPDFAVTKSDNGTATAGSQIVYTIFYTNAGNQNATGVVLTETVAQHTTYSGSGWTCAPSSAAGSVCTRSIGSLAGGGAGGSATFTVTVSNPLDAGVATIANTVSIGDDNANGSDPTSSNNSSTITTTVNAAPDFAVTKKDNGTATAGSQIVYTIFYTNAGNQNATGVVLTETVAQHTTYSGSGWTCAPSSAAGSVCTYAIGDLDGGGTHGMAAFAVTVDSTLPAGVNDISNTVSIGDDGTNGADPTQGDATATVSTTVNAAPDLAISKTDGGVGTTPGGEIRYTISFTNSGDQGATGVVVTETVPAGTLFSASASSPSWVCTPDGGAGHICRLPIGGLSARSSGAISFTVTVTDPVSAGLAFVSNTVSIGDDRNNGADATPGDESASDTTPVTSAPEMQISKQADTLAALPASVVKFTLSYTNAGNIGASGVKVTETVPALATFSGSDSTAGWTCSSINPGGVCTLDVGAVNGRGSHGAVIFAVKLYNPIEAQADPIILFNTALIGDDGSNGVDPNMLNNVATLGIDVTPTNFAKFSWANSVGQGYAAHFTIVLRNTGAEAMHNVVISDILPLNVRFSDATVAVQSDAMPSIFSGWAASGGVYDGNRTVVWNVGDVPPGRYVAIKVLVYVYSGTPAGTVLTNTAVLSAGGQPAITAESWAVVVATSQVRPPEPTTTPAPTPPSALCPVGAAGRVDVGSAISYTDSFGHIWAADQAYAPGQNTWGYTAPGFVYSTQHAIAATDDPKLYQTERWWPNSGGYRFSVANGNYEVTLKLAEIYAWASTGSRVFAVTIENSVVMTHLDVVQLAGQYTAYDVKFSVTVQDGLLNVDFRSEQGSPSLKAIMYERMATCGTGGPATPTATPQPPVSASPTPSATPVAGAAPRCAPLRIDAGATVAHSDSMGSVWRADQGYVRGMTTWGYKGRSAVYGSSAAIAATSDPLLYRSERWWEQNGGYDVEVPRGSYQVTLKFAEIYPWASVGTRAFDVRIEDALVLSHLDVFGRAGANAAYDVTFTAIVSDGLLSIDFVKQHGSPALNGLVITPLAGCAAGG